jgi:hypothetical protein
MPTEAARPAAGRSCRCSSASKEDAHGIDDLRLRHAASGVRRGSVRLRNSDGGAGRAHGRYADLAERLAERNDLSFLDADAARRRGGEAQNMTSRRAGRCASDHVAPAGAVVLARADDEAGRDRADLGALRAVGQVQTFVPVAAATEVHAPRRG